MFIFFFHNVGVKQLCCETTYCFCTNSYYWVSSNYVARQPIVFVQILIIGCQATMLRDNLLFSYEFLLLGVKQLCCETTYCFRTNSYYYWVSSNYVARQPIVFVRILIIGCQATMLRDNPLFSYEFLLLGVKQLCCETTYCFCMNSYYWVSSNYVARQPIVFVRILIIGCQATKLRDNLLFLYEFLLLLFYLRGSQWQPIEPLGEKL
jgi:hypothetical protein